MMEITADKLLQIIGSMYVEMTVMRAEIERLRGEQQKSSEIKKETVTPLRPSSA